MTKLIYTTLLLLLFSTLHAQTFQDAFPNLSFSRPVDIQNSGIPGDDRLFIVEQDGRIRVVQNNSNTSSSSVFLDIRSRVNFTNGQEKGLLGLAFHPNYQQNGQFYVSYTGASGSLIRIIIERYTVSSNPNFANSNTACQVIAFNKNQFNSNHNGGSIAFGPDGRLYASVGDGGGGNDPQGNAQNLNSLFGKILRLNVNVGCPGYGTDGNPLVGANGRNEIYAWGLRNSWRMSWDFQTNRLWAGDVGQGQREEINIIQRGRNYGWKFYEGFNVANGNSPTPSNAVFPVFSYNHNQGDRSITGGYVYRGSENGSLNGRYIFGDFVSGRIWSLNTGNNSRSLLFDTNFSVSTFGQDINDELYFTDYGSGKIYKIISDNTPPPPPPSGDGSFSASGCTISLSGLNGDDFVKIFDAGFNEVWTCNPYNGSPCSSNESFTASSDGTYAVQERDGTLTRFELTGCGSSNPPTNSGSCSVSSQNCTITISNLNSNDFVKIFDEDFNELWTCNPYNGNPCSGNESYTAPAPGTYFVQECDDSFTRVNLTGCNGNTPPTNPGPCGVSSQNCTITIGGLNSNDFVKVFDAGFNEVFVCSPYNGNPCSGNESYNAPTPGTYFVQECDGTLTPITLTDCNGSTRNSASSNLAALDIQISPNPTEGDLSVNLSDFFGQEIDLFLTDLSGKIYLTKKIGRDQNPILNLDISAFRNGMYFLYVKAENRKGVVKKISLINTY